MGVAGEEVALGAGPGIGAARRRDVGVVGAVDELGVVLVGGVVGEGGGVETDGQGTLMAHESSWVNPNRSTLSRDVIEERLLTALGAILLAGLAPTFRMISLPDEFLEAGALPTLHDLYGISTKGVVKQIKGWL